MVLKRGSSGADVGKLNRLLQQWGFPSSGGNVFDGETEKAVRAFQASHADRDGLPLKVDGIVGGLTWWALNNPRVENSARLSGVDFGTMPPAAAGGSPIGREALRIAIDQRAKGAGEVGGNNLGPWVKQYLDGLAPVGSDWCAGFVSWCLREANGGVSPMPYSVGARRILTQADKLGWKLKPGDLPEPGDIVVWWRKAPTAWQGHVGFVYSLDNGKLYTIEGNKTAKVDGFSYTYDTMERVLGFCRVGNVQGAGV